MRGAKEFGKRSLALHLKKHGKWQVASKVGLATRNDLSVAYTPGVGAVSSAIGADKSKSWTLTNRANQVAVISDGSAILGLGDLGPEAAMPVMEGKAIIFKKFASIDAVPICIDCREVEDIVSFCKAIAPSFAGINLEDISAPRCFEVVRRLEKSLSIPVMHDDQDGTAIVILAALTNACKVAGISLADARVVINGAGAAGLATARLLLYVGIGDLVILDSKGILSRSRVDLTGDKLELVRLSNKRDLSGDLATAMRGANIFIGLSKAGLVTEAMVRSMDKGAIVLAMANPVPEIMPEAASRAGALIVGTGRSDLANQVNNALVFPGVFRGLLDSGIKIIDNPLKVSVARAIASVVKPSKNKILPLVTDLRVVGAIRKVFLSRAKVS